jgi:hypothetical protein
MRSRLWQFTRIGLAKLAGLNVFSWKTVERLALLSGIAYAVVTYVQWKDIGNNFKMDERAWIGPAKISLTHLQAPDPISTSVGLTNFGKTPALNVTTSCALPMAADISPSCS